MNAMSRGNFKKRGRITNALVRHGRGREREAQLTEPVKGKPPTAVQSTLDRIRQPCDEVNKRSERAASPLVAPQILRNEVKQT